MAQTIIVDISTRGANPVAYTHQGDTGRTFFAEIYENGEAFAVAGYTIKVGAILPADRGYTVIAGNDMVTATKTNDNTTNKIYFTLSDKYSLKAGNGILTLIFTSNTGTPSTIRPINIDLRIQKSADADDTIAGASDFPEGLESIAESVFQEYLSTYLPPVAPSSSAAANKAADAKLTGEALDDLKSEINQQSILTDLFRAALENIFEKVAYIDENGEQYLEKVVSALLTNKPTEDEAEEHFNYRKLIFDHIERGKYIGSDGTIGSNSGSSYERTFYEVDENYQYEFIIYSDNYRLSFYDSNLDFIEQIQYTTYNGVKNFVSLPEGTKYVRIGWYRYDDGSYTPTSYMFVVGTSLPMVLGNISATTGENETMSTPSRIRTVGYIPVNGNTITVKYCPFSSEWVEEYLGDYGGYAFRCYDSNKTFIGSLVADGGVFKGNIVDATLPTGTAYVRMFIGASTDRDITNFATKTNKSMLIAGNMYWITQG